MTMDKRTLREWMVYLDSTERELTLTEFMAVMLFNSREYTRIMLEIVRELKNASEHSEAVLGAIDLLAERVAASSGLPYPSSHDQRAAMASRWRSGEPGAAVTAIDGHGATEGTR